MGVKVAPYLSPAILEQLKPSMANVPIHTPQPYKRIVTTNETNDAGASGEPNVNWHSESGDGPWQQMTPSTFFSLIYSANARPDMNGEKDIDAHNKLLDSGELGLVNPAGTAFRMVEMTPRKEGEMAHFMHRTESLDLGVVLKGEVELHVPGSEPRIMKAGDVAVQRGTMHSWINHSTTEPSRMLFALVAADPVQLQDGTELKHSLPMPPPGLDIDTEAMLKAKRTQGVRHRNEELL